MSGTIIVVKAKRGPKATKRVRERVAAVQCVSCGNPIRVENGKLSRWRRGDCTKCEARWEAAKRGLTDEQAAELEARLISDGDLLAPRELAKLRSGANKFAAKAAEVTRA